MSDKAKEQQIDETARSPAEWSMPEPIFRSSEGVSPLEKDAAGDLLELPPEDEIPTETMDFVSNDAVESDDPPAVTEEAKGSAAEHLKQTVRVKEKSSRRHHKKKRSQSKLMTGLALAVGLLIGGVILAAIYFLFR